MTRAFTLRLVPEVAATLDTISEVDNAPVSEIIREAITEHIRRRIAEPDFQDALRARIAAQSSLLDGNVPRETSGAQYGNDPAVPPLVHPFGTCDWGDCSRPSVVWRFEDPSIGWLPVCTQHRNGRT